mmetsp:Transcript_52428/g.59936  ORF Transcript_52428/g.59936 Transcript_52428/m.59936 type:complete len:187 (+) Transcript_52428:107-667(+)
MYMYRLAYYVWWRYNYTTAEKLTRFWFWDTVFCTMFVTMFGMGLATLVIYHSCMIAGNVSSLENNRGQPCCIRANGGGDPLNDSIYDLGIVANIVSVLGENPLTWFLPNQFYAHPGVFFWSKNAMIAELNKTEQPVNDYQPFLKKLRSENPLKGTKLLLNYRTDPLTKDSVHQDSQATISVREVTI